MQTYAQTKLAATALAPALADMLEEYNVCIRAVDPGATKTAMTTKGNTAMPLLLRWLSPFLFASAEKQALKIVDSAAPGAFDGRTGIFVANRKPKPLPATIADTDVQDALTALLDGCL
jgi:NAD(P)-dependent dehydrogenase (short-subunit alcohol dehydrogenase family)